MNIESLVISFARTDVSVGESFDFIFPRFCGSQLLILELLIPKLSTNIAKLKNMHKAHSTYFLSS